MILGTLAQSGRYDNLHPRFKKGFEFLMSPQSRTLPAGRHPIDGDGLYAVVVRDQGKGSAARLEIHKKYIDIQCVISGTDSIGYTPAAACQSPDGAFDETKDLGFFSDKPETWLTVPPESFGIFYPEDAHAPMGGQGALHKIVVKVAM